jgi:hypothetical protein
MTQTKPLQLVFISTLLLICNAHAGTFEKELFSCIYRANAWGDHYSRSGPGSNLEQTDTIRNVLPQLIAALNVTTMLDAPCGDFYWMNHTDLSRIEHYIGSDIVDELIAKNQEQYSDTKKEFIVCDITQDNIPTVDLILCRDCLPHLTYADIALAINNFKKSGSTYLLTSHYPDTQENQDLTNEALVSLWRFHSINFQKAPFNFPKPLFTLEEGFNGKHLALWRITDLPTFTFNF